MAYTRDDTDNLTGERVTYSWDDAANEILKQKKAWNDATYEKDTGLAKAAAQNAAQYYDILRKNGDGELADALQSRDYASAQKYYDAYKNNRNMTESGTYNRGQAIGAIVGQKEAWNNASYDKNTGFADDAAKNAQKVYNYMRDNGDAKTADLLYNMDYNSALKYQNDEAEKQDVVDNYNTKNAMNLIMRLWGEENAAIENGDTQKTNDLRWEINRFLNLMGENGDSVAASNLSNRNYDQSQQYTKDYMDKTGRTALRQYLYQAGAKYGLSNADIDKMISYDNDTGEITLAGVNIGKPDAVVDGVSYVSTQKAEQLANEAFAREGITMSDDERYQSQIGALDRANIAELERQNRQRDEMEKRGNELWEEGKKNVTDSTDYKRIYDRTMSQYNLAALQGRDNAAAYRAASNGGNIDSYAAANAMRQQAAMTAYGQQVANGLGLDAYKARLDNLSNIFSNLGIEYSRGNADAGNQLDRMSQNAQQVFDNSETRKNNDFNRTETAKNNDVTRKQIIAETTGHVPDEWVLSNNHFLTDDGKIKPEYEGVDFKNIINQAVANGDEETANQARIARAIKIFGDYSKWGQYDDGDYKLPGAQNTWAKDKAIMDDKTLRYQTDSAERISRDANEKSLDATTSTNSSNEKIARIQAQNSLDQIEANKNAEKELLEFQYNNAPVTTSGGSTTSNKSGGSTTSSEKKYTVGQISSAKKKLENNKTLTATDYDALISDGYVFDENGNLLSKYGGMLNETGTYNGKDYIVVSYTKLTPDEVDAGISDGSIAMEENGDGTYTLKAIKRISSRTFK